MPKRNTPLSRRNVLRSTAIGLGSLGFVNTAGAEKEPITRAIEFDTSSVDHVDEAEITFLSNGDYRIRASGSEVPVSNEAIPTVRLGAEYPEGTSQPSSFQPDRLVGKLETNDSSKEARNIAKGGGSKEKFSSGESSSDLQNSSSGGMSIQASDSDSGTDYTTDYEGGLQVQSYEATAGLSNVNHGQTSRWSSSGGEVTSYNDRYWCWYIGALANDAEHQAGGFQTTDWSGDTLESKSYSQFHRSGTVDLSYYVYLYATLTMQPNGTMDWLGEVTTSGNTDPDPPNSSFDLKTQYWSYCKDLAT